MTPRAERHTLGPAFTVAAARLSGLTTRQLRHQGLHRPTRGVRTVVPPGDLVSRAAAYSLVLPDTAAFSHLTAAQLHGLPVSYAMEEDDRLHILRPVDQPQIRREGLVGHRMFHLRALVDVGGLRVVDLADTWVDLGELVGRGKPVGLDDLIVVGDACATRTGSVTPLRRALARRTRPRGKKTLLEALTQIRVGSWSPRETRCRLMFVRVGLPEPLPNQAIYASWDPTLLLGYGDLVWRLVLPDGRVIKVIGEYQGEEFHSSDEQKAHDEARRERFARDGWVVLEIWKVDLVNTDARHATVARFAEALEIDVDTLNLSEAEPRFFSRHTMELAEQRSAQRAARL